MESLTPPKALLEELQRHDRRLGLRFDSERRLWEVVETSHLSGEVSHIFHWQDGSWREPKFKPLPTSAGPILEHLAKIDVLKMGANARSVWKMMRRGFSIERARMAAKQREDLRDRLKDFGKGMKQLGPERLMRMYRQGGASRAAAIRARLDLIHDTLGLTPAEMRNGEIDKTDIKLAAQGKTS